MARPKRCRRIQFRPPVLRFEPIGDGGITPGEVLLSLDEFEAMRLAVSKASIRTRRRNA